MELNSLSFCLSVKLLISPSYLNEILAGYSNPGCRFFSFIMLSMSYHSLLVWRVSIERSAVILMGIHLWVICCFSLAAFNVCSLCFIFVNLINMCLGVFCLGFILFGTLWVSWTCVTISFPILGKFSAIISSSIFSQPSFFVFFFWDSYDSNVGVFHIVSEVPEVVLGTWGCFNSLSFFLSASFISTILSSTSLCYLLPPLFCCCFPPGCFLSHLLHYSL